MNHEEKIVENLSFFLITVSSSRTEETDRSGKLIMDLLEESGHEVKKWRIISDDEEEISEAVKEFLDSPLEVCILSGGTGISESDVTPGVLKKHLTRELPGFGEIFRKISFEEIGTRSILSRATAGTAEGKLLFSIPGSRGAVKAAIKYLIVPLVGHAVYELEKE